MKRNILFLFIIITGLISCKSKESQVQNHIPTFFPLTQSIQVKDFMPYIDSVAILPLEATDSSFIEDIKKILITPSGQMIILNTSGILLFDEKGHFLFPVGTQGRGPEEYLHAVDICLNESATEVWALDKDKSVSKYALSNGHFIGKIIPRFSTNYPDCIGIAPASKKGFFLFGCNPYEKSDFTTPFYCLNLFDATGKHIDSLLLRKAYVLPLDAITQSYDNSYLIRPQEGDKVCYRLKGKKWMPFTNLILGGNICHSAQGKSDQDNTLTYRIMSMPPITNYRCIFMKLPTNCIFPVAVRKRMTIFMSSTKPPYKAFIGFMTGRMQQLYFLQRLRTKISFITYSTTITIIFPNPFL